MRQAAIRKFSVHDARALHELASLAFTKAYEAETAPEDLENYIATELSIESFLEASKKQGSHIFVLENEEQLLLGYLHLVNQEPEVEHNLESPLELKRLYLTPAVIGQGYGNMLMNFAKQYAVEHSHRFLWLSVWERNTRAVAFYVRAGFTEFAQVDFQVGSDVQRDRLLMYRVLAEG
jgi:diamine N-acetyltransferase